MENKFKMKKTIFSEKKIKYKIYTEEFDEVIKAENLKLKKNLKD